MNNLDYTYSVSNIRVIDGDTIQCDLTKLIETDAGFGIHVKSFITVNQKLRMLGINAPESRTRDLDEKAKGLAAKAWLKKRLADGVLITAQTHKVKFKDSFGRYLAVIICDGVDVNQEMLELNLARPFMVD